MQKHFPEF